MITKKRRLGALLGVVSILATLSACNAFKADTGDSGTGVRISVDEVSYGSTLPKNDKIKPQLDSRVGIDLDLRPIASEEDHYNQLGASLAAGTSGEFFQVDRPHLQQLVSQGLILDLSPFLKNELQDYAAWIGDDPLKIATFDQKTYAIANQPAAGPYGSLWIRKDWLDKLNLDLPKTTEDLSKVATAFTKEDPDGNKRKDTYGIVGGGFDSLSVLFPAFGSGGPGNFYVKDGQVINGYADPATEDGLAYMRGLFEAGVVSPDTLSLDPPKALDQAMQGKAGIVPTDFSQMGTAAAQIKEAQPDAEWVQLQPPVGPDGESGVPYDPNSTKMFAIPADISDEKRDKLFALLNYISSEDGNRLVSYGIEDTDWTLQNGEPKLTDAALDKTTDERGFSWMYQLTGRPDAAYLKRGGTPYTAETVDIAIEQPQFHIYNSLVTAPKDYNIADAERFADEGMIAFLSGKDPLDGYDAFLKTLNGRFGYDRYVQSGTTQLKELGVG